jgi:hypothetical protein
MAHIDVIALQQRLAQQQPKPVPAEPPSWSTRPVSALRTTSAPKGRPATASAAPPAGTLHATTTMRAALPLKAPNARAERAEERARTNALREQIDVLNAEMVVMRAEADRALAEERHRADLLRDRVDVVQRDLDAVRAEAERTTERAERALTGERQRADALRDRLDQAQAELAVAQHDAQTAQQAAAALRQAEADRKARGLVARLRAAWRGE